MTPEEAIQPSRNTPKMTPGIPKGCPEGAPETSEAPLGSPKCTQNDARTSPEAPQGPPEASRNWPKAKKKNRKCPKHETSYFTTSQHLVFYEVKMIRASRTSLFTMRQHLQAQGLSRATFWSKSLIFAECPMKIASFSKKLHFYLHAKHIVCPECR